MKDKWTMIAKVNTTTGRGYIDYINQEETQIKRVWHDGYEETFEATT